MQEQWSTKHWAWLRERTHQLSGYWNTGWVQRKEKLFLMNRDLSDKINSWLWASFVFRERSIVNPEFPLISVHHVVSQCVNTSSNSTSTGEYCLLLSRVATWFEYLLQFFWILHGSVSFVWFVLKFGIRHHRWSWYMLAWFSYTRSSIDQVEWVLVAFPLFYLFIAIVHLFIQFIVKVSLLVLLVLKFSTWERVTFTLPFRKTSVQHCHVLSAHHLQHPPHSGRNEDSSIVVAHYFVSALEVGCLHILNKRRLHGHHEGIRLWTISYNIWIEQCSSQKWIRIYPGRCLERY